jgi:D-glycero-D-manno-heptose 1,7-bisphosphate phosphatase
MTRPLSKAVFLDRDGIINELVYYPEHGIVDSPSHPDQLRLVEGIGKSLRRLKALNFKLILISNQPGVAKGHFSLDVFRAIDRRMETKLSKSGVKLDDKYYCLHHPRARVTRYRYACNCRKPEPGLFQRSAREHGLSLRKSVAIGDGIVDVIAGQRAGCTTILVSNVNSLLVRRMNEMKAEPDYIVLNMQQAVEIITNLEKEGRSSK